jgi:hypothetical protein
MESSTVRYSAGDVGGEREDRLGPKKNKVTQILLAQITCSACGEQFEARLLASWSTFGYDRFIPRDRATCPNCGHEEPGAFVEWLDWEDAPLGTIRMELVERDGRTFLIVDTGSGPRVTEVGG